MAETLTVGGIAYPVVGDVKKSLTPLGGWSRSESGTVRDTNRGFKRQWTLALGLFEPEVGRTVEDRLNTIRLFDCTGEMFATTTIAGMETVRCLLEVTGIDYVRRARPKPVGGTQPFDYVVVLNVTAVEA